MSRGKPDVEKLVVRWVRSDGKAPANDQRIDFKCRFVAGQAYHAKLLSWE